MTSAVCQNQAMHMVKRMEHMVIVIVMVMDKAGNRHVFTVLHISLERLCFVFLQKSALGLNMFSNIPEHRKDVICLMY